MEYNGGSVVAMVGKNCAAIASDLRLGNQALTIATNFEKVRRRFWLSLCRSGLRVASRRGAALSLSPFSPLPSSCSSRRNAHQVFPVTERVYLGMAGLATDIQTL